ncbi:ATPase, T2SS/T4P/T4SS family [Limnobacter humi]|uniref:ATPase, T2SS/T4P/T4SS family n=1 Tax=Limnobacter humi TaxID=1778671 RepID=A0ABT1WIV0_9BURK|nr:ATPase, T2SS/T4P/T4SS family [Limnobacter humi]MCQ8897451.1 ATPase, T2SS/T4P/T4SS family [Limnobacter humi]
MSQGQHPFLTALQSTWADVLTYAHGAGASDLHLTAGDNHYHASLRIAGHIGQRQTLLPTTARALIQTLKAACNMNIAESRRPQDGRLSHLGLDIRLATHPGLHGESLVIRLLNTHAAQGLGNLNFPAPLVQSLRKLATLDHGLLLVAGATGAGKSTTLHAILHELGEHTGRLVTLEEPVEVIHPKALQTDLTRLPHLDVAAGLRSLMRQDPDTILIGEIRDVETAQLTLHAALTGHRVLASVHAPDCTGALYRLMELGVPLPSLLNCLNGVLAQQLRPCTQRNGHRRPVAELMDFTTVNRGDLLDCDRLSDLHQLLRNTGKPTP